MLTINKFGIIGSFKHSIDSKNRLFLPAKLRDFLGDTVVLTRGLKPCLYLFTVDGWNDFAENLGSDIDIDSNETMLYFFGNAVDLDVDSQGRITVPQALRNFSGIGKDVTIVGTGRRLEIWKTEDWEAFNNDKSLPGRIAEEKRKKQNNE